MRGGMNKLLSRVFGDFRLEPMDAKTGIRRRFTYLHGILQCLSVLRGLQNTSSASGCNGTCYYVVNVLYSQQLSQRAIEDRTLWVPVTLYFKLVPAHWEWWVALYQITYTETSDH
jgi:hypothetical protein